MLPRVHRLPLRRFPDFFISARRVHGKGLLMWWRIAEQVSPTLPQVAIVVPKKVAAHAVDRHRLKRQLTELVFAELKHRNPLTNLQVVVMPKTHARTWTVDQLQTDLHTLWPSLS